MSTSANYATVVQELYVSYFGRPADPGGLQNFEAALAAANAPTTLAGLSAQYGVNPAITALVNAFGDSAESGRLYGTAINLYPAQAQQFVTAVFENLFDRAPLQAGLQFWSNALLTGSMTPGEAAMEIALGAATADAATFNNKIAAASAFTGDLITIGTTGYSGPVAAADGRAFLAGISGSTTSTTYQTGAITAIDNMLGISPTPTPTPTHTPTLALTVSGDTVHLSGTTAASTVNLVGADLTAYPSSTYGTVAQLVSVGTTSVTDSGGNFTLNASGNANATTFNFGTGAVSGADAASSAGITYTGVTTYITSDHGDTVTLSGATQNVTASNDGNTVNLGNLTYTGTLNFTAGSGGTDTINATVGGNLSGATIAGTSSGVAKIALVLSAAGSETLSTAEYNTITSTTGGNITFTGSTGSSDHIVFATGGTVTAITNVGNYTLSSAGNTITLNNVADNVTGDPTAGNDIVNLGALTYTGSTAFGTGGTDSVHVTIGGNISSASITSSGAAVSLVLSAAGTETLSTSEYNLFNSHGISGGTFGGDTITLANAGTVTANANVGNYDLSTFGNTITLNNVGDNVSGAASGNDTVNLAALTYTGTTTFGAAGSDSIHVTVGGNISGGTITSGGATVSLVLSGAGTETLSTAEYNLFNATGISGGTFGGDTIDFSNAGTVTANANVGNYTLSSSGSTTIHLNGATENVTAGSGATVNDTIDLAALTYTGTLNFGGNSTDTVDVTIGGDISSATLNASGAQVALALSGSGSETLSVNEYNLFNSTGGISGGSAGSDTIVFSDAGTVTDTAAVGNYTLYSGDTITVTQTGTNVDASDGSDTINLGAITYSGTLKFGMSTLDTVQVSGGDIHGATFSNSGAVFGLEFTNSGAATETMTTTQYGSFGSFSGGTAANNTIAFSDAAVSVADNSAVGNYTLHSGDTFTINNAASNVDATAGSSTIKLAGIAYTGTLALDLSNSDSLSIAAGANLSGGTVSGTAPASVGITSSGTITVSSAELNMFHGAAAAITTSGTTTIAVADSTNEINLNAQENNLASISLQADNNVVNISIGAASVNSGAAGFNKTIVENGSGGNNAFNIDNGGTGATIVGASDATHYVTINNFNTTSDSISLTLSNNAQTSGEQDISDSGNDTITVGVNGVIVEENLGALPGFTTFNATDLASAQANMLRAINASASTSGEYTFVIDSNQGAAIYEIDVNSGASTIDGIQLIGVVHGVGAFNLIGHVV